MIEIKRYDGSKKELWDAFCKASLNSIFLFYRDYMDYHADRFRDHSLLFYKGNRPVALLPCSERTQGILSSHDGLTFGGFIMGEHTHQTDMLECADALVQYCKETGIREVFMKPVPLPFRRVASEQDVFALIKNGAELVRSEPSTVTKIRGYVPNNGEKRKCRYALQANLSCRLCEDDADWIQYHRLLAIVLLARHNTAPVHTAAELLLLHKRFPEHMKLFGVFAGKEMLAGTVVYEYHDTVHTQYMASGDEGRNKGALHYCIQSIVEYYADREWLDFGISSENQGKTLNTGLLRFKEGFHGNTLLFHQWKLSIK